MSLLQRLEKSHPGFQRSFDIFGQNCFIGMMADAARAAQKQHGRRHPASDNHGIVTGTARHAMNRESRALDGTPERPHEIGIHRDGRLIQTLLRRNRQAAGGRNLPGASQQPRGQVMTNRIL
jgi:hypothetical protein